MNSESLNKVGRCLLTEEFCAVEKVLLVIGSDDHMRKIIESTALVVSMINDCEVRTVNKEDVAFFCNTNGISEFPVMVCLVRNEVVWALPGFRPLKDYLV